MPPPAAVEILRRPHRGETGHVFWLFGLSGSGKSTLAEALARELRTGLRCGPPLMLDGDRLRAGLCAGLGFDDAARTENLRRAAEVARLGVESGLTVIAAFITPREAQRELVAGLIGVGRISLVHVAAPLATCQRRDVKGLYARAAVGGVPQMTGVSSGFELPLRVDLQLHTDRESPAASAARLTDFALGRIQGAAA